MEKGHFMNNSNGVSLLEVLLSIAILSILTISILSFFNQAYDYTKRNEDKTVGINVARNVLYYMEQQDYEKVNTAYLKQLQDLTGTKAKDEGIPVSCDNTQVFDKNVCEDFFTTKINNTPFETKVMIKLPEDDQTITLSDGKQKVFLFPLEVTVTWNDGKTSATVEGVIQK